MSKARVYTKTGDGGSTGLLDGSRVPKHDPRLEAYGTVDEAQAALGVVEGALRRLAVAPWREDLLARLGRVQEVLFAWNAALADPSGEVAKRIQASEADVAALEAWMDEYLDALPPQTRFIRPGACLEQAHLHVARTVCRRAERRVAALGDRAPGLCLRYLNRLSDFLFVASRWVVARTGHEETHF